MITITIIALTVLAFGIASSVVMWFITLFRNQCPCGTPMGPGGCQYCDDDRHAEGPEDIPGP